MSLGYTMHQVEAAVFPTTTTHFTIISVNIYANVKQLLHACIQWIQWVYVSVTTGNCAIIIIIILCNHTQTHTHTHAHLMALYPGVPGWAGTRKVQKAQLLPSDCAMRLVSSNLASCHATVQKLLIRQVLTKLMVWSWRFSRRQCVMNNVHSTMTRLSRLPLSQVS